MHTTMVIVGAVSYLLIVRLLRYRRLEHIGDTYGPVEMTPWIAQRVLHLSLFYEVPFTMYLGTVVALFKIYGIPTVSSLLLKTGELKTRDGITRRMADTGTLIATWVTNPLIGPRSGCEISEDCGKSVDPRNALAIARVNWLHRKYPIRNDDYRYNLALFMLEPLRMTTRFGWRPHSELEKQAIFIFWMEIGKRMGIQDLWETFAEMEAWAECYERDYMLPSKASAELAQTAIGHFTHRLPNVLGLRKFMKDVISFFLDERTRRAMMLPDPSLLVSSILLVLLSLVRILTRHLSLPRRKPSMWVTTDDPPEDYLIKLHMDELPRMHATFKRPRGPWYYPEPRGIRKTVQNCLVWLGVLSAETVPGKHWKSEGYRIEELGPARFERLGHHEVMSEATKLQGVRITGPWALDGGRGRTT